MADLKIADAPELTTIEGDEKIPTGNSGGNFSIVTDALAQFVKDSKDLQSGAEVDAAIDPVEMEIATHVADLVNPHQVTKDQVGLGNVDNTADADKPISNAVQSAITTLATTKADKTYVDSQLATKSDKLTTYTKTEVDALLVPKANQSTTYTKVEVDTKLSDKQERLSIDGVLTGTNTFSNVPNLDGLDGNPSTVMNQQAQALMNRTENLRYGLKTGLNYFDSSYATSIGGYPLSARIALSTGEVVTSTVVGNTVDPNADMTGWISSVRGIVRSKAELESLVGVNGQTVLMSSWHSGLNKGGGIFIYDSTKSSINNHGTIINGWVRQLNGVLINPYMFGAKGDGVTDDYQALYNCFNHHYNPEVGTTDPNALQNSIPSITFFIPYGCYRYTQPLRMPCKGNIICEGNINYFPRPNIVYQKNRATFFYDGADLEVAAMYMPAFKNVDGSWQLITDSTEFFTYAAGISMHPLIRGCEYKFNLITKRKTKIGFNAFGLEAGVVDVGIGTLGTYSNPQAQPSWADYDADDLSPKVGITICTAWNLVLNRVRILAHNQGVYVDGSTGSIVIREGYINRQVSTAASSVTDGLVYGDNTIIPVAKQGLTAAITAKSADIDFYNVITEGWGCPYIFLGGRYTLFTPHIEGPNEIMMHDFMVYNCKLDVYNWGNTRSMQLRANTSIVYSCGMASDQGYYVHLHGSSYYRDNSLFNLLDGVPYDQYTNAAFLKISNVPNYKAIAGFYISDLRNVKSVGLQGEGSVKLPIYLDTSRAGMKSLGLGTVNAVQSLADLVEVIRILGNQWNNIVSLPKGLNISAETTFDISPYTDSIEFNISSGFSFTSANRFKIKCRRISFSGNGSLVATSPVIEPLSDTTLEIKNATVTGASAIIRSDSLNAYKHTLKILGNVNMVSWGGYYVFGSSTTYGLVDLIILGSRTQAIKDREVTNNNLSSAGAKVSAFLYAP